MTRKASVLIDTSALAWMRHPVVAELLAPRITVGMVATCASLDAAALRRTRDTAEYEQLRADLRDLYEYVPTNEQHWQNAFTIQRELARSGRHRAVGFGSLLASVVAVEHGLVLFHYDADFETVASVVDLNHRWVAPRGSLETS
ncbi:VapC toxin family PIN domain ribonuclease [Nocardia sp. NPDC058176]|uniref:VapC toxin family PIN domain ribonuclease n=1 Tax=Nocardia sp. NPDC058176 TaxID=3346368 RepID=UPI0036DF4B1C